MPKRKTIVIDDPELISSIERISSIVGMNLKDTMETLLRGNMARKAAWGDSLHVSEPGMEFNKLPDGERMRGQQLYESVYQQMKAFINTLLLGERLLIALIALCRKAGILQFIKEDDLKKAAAVYVDKIEKQERAYVN
ncbi:MAG: hypothetical protein PHU49_03635 [Syntrophorhabdaceae bacterium]|nr:hypothetical protein [Syntrophorhabdaceae bacterium]MDD5243087.1 hypothetical protein [Syntrophorhabdaceae bacterium]